MKTGINSRLKLSQNGNFNQTLRKAGDRLFLRYFKEFSHETLMKARTLRLDPARRRVYQP